MGEQLSDGYCILEERARAIKIRGPIGTETEVGRFPAIVHAVKVTAGVLEAGRSPFTVATACGRPMPRSAAQPELSWENHLKGPGQTRPCGVCRERMRELP